MTGPGQTYQDMMCKDGQIHDFEWRLDDSGYCTICEREVSEFAEWAQVFLHHLYVIHAIPPEMERPISSAHIVEASTEA